MQFVTLSDKNVVSLIRHFEPEDEMAQAELAVLFANQMNLAQSRGKRYTIELGSFGREWELAKDIKAIAQARLDEG